MGIEIKISGNLKTLAEKVPEKRRIALESCGQMGEGYAKMLCPVASGDLRNSITHDVNDMASFGVVYIGSNKNYAPYVELGTGKYVPGGSPPWVYTPDGGETFYRTEGQPPKPFIKPAVADHEQQYMDIIKQVFSTE